LLIYGDSENNTNKLGDASKEKVGFGGDSRKRATVSNSEIIFENIDSAFNESTVTIEIIPMVSTTRNTGIEPQIFMRINICTFVRIVGTRIIAGTSEIIGGFDSDKLATDIFVTG